MNEHRILTVLAIETSCDETAVAVFNTQRGVVAHKLFSQVELHRLYGGVIPEVASRSHLDKMLPLLQEVLANAHVTLDDITTIAATYKPGLPGSLLIGLCCAKALAYTHQKRFIGINHLEGHIFSSSIEHQVPFPHLCLAASGGHTSLYLVEGYGVYTAIATTRDDAAGEAFDKVAKLLNLGYPGGARIEKEAERYHFVDDRAYPRLKHDTLDFSFSGLKTAVLYDLARNGFYDLKSKKLQIDHLSEQEKNKLIGSVSSSFLVCVGDIFAQRIQKARTRFPHVRALTFVGGVACNRYLSARLEALAAQAGLSFFKPSPSYCTDNAAMIAYVAHYRAQKGEAHDLSLDIY